MLFLSSKISLKSIFSLSKYSFTKKLFLQRFLVFLLYFVSISSIYDLKAYSIYFKISSYFNSYGLVLDIILFADPTSYSIFDLNLSSCSVFIFSYSFEREFLSSISSIDSIENISKLSCIAFQVLIALLTHNTKEL